MNEGGSDWARWTRTADDFTVGVEEEVMLLDRSGWALDQAFHEVRDRLSPKLADRLSAETHASTIEFETAPSPTAGAATRELTGIRAALAAELATLDRAAAGSGTHPFVTWEETRLSNEERYRYLHRSMRELVHREPTFAMHVHVAIGDPELAIKVLNRMRVHLPLLLALSANSPYWQGRDSGIASIRTPIFGTFPRSGIPRRFDDYAQYTEALDTLIACGAFPDPGFVWWDLRLQPTLGTVEMRVMDTQPETWRAGALIALTQSLTRLEALEEPRRHPWSTRPNCSRRTGSARPATARVRSCSTPNAVRRSRFPSSRSSLLMRCAITLVTSGARTSSIRSSA